MTNADKAMPLMVLAVMVQMMLCGGLFPVSDGAAPVSWLVPARWAFALASSTVDVNPVQEHFHEETDPLWGHEVGIWVLDLLAVVVIGVLLLLVCARVLRRLDAPRRR